MPQPSGSLLIPKPGTQAVAPVLAVTYVDIAQPLVCNIALKTGYKNPHGFFMRNNKNIFLRLTLQPVDKTQHAPLVIQQRLAAIHPRIKRIVRNRCKIFAHGPAVKTGAYICDIRTDLNL